MAKNIFVYYLLIVFPIILLGLGAKTGYISATAFSGALLIYALIYHPIVSGLRLLQSGKINKSEFWKNFIPFWNDKYWTFLFFGK